MWLVLLAASYVVPGVFGGGCTPYSSHPSTLGWCFYFNLDCPQDTVPRTKSCNKSTFDDCMKACDLMDDCDGFNWPNGELKTHKCEPDRQNSSQTYLFIRHPAPAPTPPPPPSPPRPPPKPRKYRCWQHQAWYGCAHGGILRGNVSTLEQTEKVCDATPGCGFFNYPNSPMYWFVTCDGTGNDWATTACRDST